MSFGSIQSMKGILKSEDYNEVMEFARGGTDQVKIANFVHDALPCLKLADPLNAIATFRAFCRTRTIPSDVDKGMGRVEGWFKAVRGGIDALGGADDTAKGLILLAGLKRAWDGPKYAAILKKCKSMKGQGDASTPKMARWFYNFAFLWKGPLDVTDIAAPGDARVYYTGGNKTIKIFDNRLKHITDGHTFAYYLFDQEEVGNLERAINGIQSFWPEAYGPTEIAADLKSALQNAPEIKQKLQAAAAGWVNVSTPFHIRLSLVVSTNGVYRASTAFPGTVQQPNTHRIPQTFLKEVYDLMAPGLGMASLKSVKTSGVTEFDKAMAATKTH